ncbi:ricin-type beta-trefoil lectin domain protein [Thalassospira lucentensis]|uniref:ricin-type beta-trefoil lectin domain protein n=1 Tax=Thalassospira lucentensis TaxID=168935 RepID=UPI003D2EAFA8
MQIRRLTPILNYAGLLLLALLMMIVMDRPAHASSQWKNLQGTPECGGVDKRGKLQEPCGRVSAKFESKAVGKCPDGSFFDLGTWSCYACPDGYNRNAKSISGDKACDRPMKSTQHVTATFLGKKECPAGSFLDKRNGGECWSCPKGYGRTAASVDKWNACGMVLKKAVSATFEGRACPQDSFTDPRNGGECWSCPEGFNRTATAVTGNKACVKTIDFMPATKITALTCPAGQAFDFIDGGTCWSCPETYVRTSFSVKGPKACKATEMKWSSPKRNMPGLFGLSPAVEELTLELVRDRTEIDEIIAETVHELDDTTVEELSYVEWLLIENEPWRSEALASVIAQRLMKAAATAPGKRTALEKRLLDDVGVQIQWNRQFIASQLRQVFENWEKTKELEFAEDTRHNMLAFAGAISEAPNFNEVLSASLQGGAMAGTFASGIGNGFFMASFKAFAPYRNRAAQAGTEAAAKLSAKVLTKIVTPLGKVSVTMTRMVSGAAGPALTAITTAISIAMEIDKIIKIEAAEGKIRQAELIASRPADIPLLLQEKTGEEQFLYHWSALIAAETRPSANYARAIASIKAGGTVAASTGPVMPVIVGGTAYDGGKAAIAAESKVLNDGLKKQEAKVAGTFRLEFTASPGLCLVKQEGDSLVAVLGKCNTPEAPWVFPNARTRELVVIDNYCLSIEAEKLGVNDPIWIRKCSNANLKTWGLDQVGQIRYVGTGRRMCMTVADAKPAIGSVVKMEPCKVKRIESQVWRPWTYAG